MSDLGVLLLREDRRIWFSAHLSGRLHRWHVHPCGHNLKLLQNLPEPTLGRRRPLPLPQIKRRKVEAMEVEEKPWQVMCDVCPLFKLKASKSCLVGVLLSGVCICLLCSEAEHKDHQFVSVEEEAALQRENIESNKGQIKLMINNRTEKIKEVTEISEMSRVKATQEMEDSERTFYHFDGQSPKEPNEAQIRHRRKAEEISGEDADCCRKTAGGNSQSCRGRRKQRELHNTFTDYMAHRLHCMDRADFF
ncbi:hypothetical protein OJAV_G00179450 [Oryzias javanicus]|uniref:Uncharacterized protein n=1 Tax=Oryzias javanicus TaxID=123683 RepID=A0A437CC29_ORYJA|nr:hypothetical protein OJAV_G00179450 [Oryzias javanicus]